MDNPYIRSFGLTVGAALFIGCASVPPTTAQAPISIDGKATRLEGTRYLEYRIGVNVQASPAEVWKVLTDASRYPDWNSTVVKLDGRIAKNEEIELVSTLDPERTFELTVSTFDPNKKLVWQDGGATFKGVRTFTLTTKTDGSTDVTMAEVFTGMFMSMIEGSLPDFRPSFEAFLADLKRTTEANAPLQAAQTRPANVDGPKSAPN